MTREEYDRHLENAIDAGRQTLMIKTTIAEIAAKSIIAAKEGPKTAEEWWTNQAEILAVKMKIGGVESFAIKLNEKGTYDFVVTPVP